MRTWSSAFSLLAGGLLAAAPLSAQEVVDQSQPVVGSGFTSTMQPAGQTFVQTGGNISGVGIFIQSIIQNPASGTVQFSLYDAIPGSTTTANLLASGSQTLTLNTKGSSWVDFHFDPYVLAPGTPLFLSVMGNVLGFQTSAKYDVAGSTYANGLAYTYAQSKYLAEPAYDLTFRTYTTLAAPVTTPEPASITLLATGLIGIAGAARRRVRRAS